MRGWNLLTITHGKNAKIEYDCHRKNDKIQSTVMSTMLGYITLPLGGKQGKFKDKYVLYNDIVFFQEHHTKSLVIKFWSKYFKKWANYMRLTWKQYCLLLFSIVLFL